MAIHEDELSMVRESLSQYLELARLGIDRADVLGYAAATLLFAFVDAVGSYHRRHPTFRVRLEGEELAINQPHDHLRILNSAYFGLDLTGDQINRLYGLTRSPLTHNAVLGAGCVLWAGTPAREAIAEERGLLHIYLPGLLERCENARGLFLTVAEEVIPESRAVQELQEKEESREVQVRRVMAELAGSGVFEIAQVTAMGRTTARSLVPRK